MMAFPVSLPASTRLFLTLRPSLNPVAYTTAGLSYDDLFFPAGNSPADCPGYPFSGGDFDILGVAFNVTGGYVGEFFSDGNFPGYSGPVYAAADANSTIELDNPNPDGTLPEPTGVVGTFTAPSYPNPARCFCLPAVWERWRYALRAGHTGLERRRP